MDLSTCKLVSLQDKQLTSPGNQSLLDTLEDKIEDQSLERSGPEVAVSSIVWRETGNFQLTAK